MAEQNKNKTFKIIGDGVVLEFFKAFDIESKGLKIKLWKWFDSCFQFTRCDFSKEISHFRIFYRDAKTKDLKKNLLQYRSSKDSNGIDLTIKLSGDLITEPLKTFVGSEFIAQYDGLTEWMYKEFFTTEVKSITQAFSDTAKIKGIVEYGKLSTKSQLESILQEWRDPVPPQFLGGATK